MKRHGRRFIEIINQEGDAASTNPRPLIDQHGTCKNGSTNDNVTESGFTKAAKTTVHPVYIDPQGVLME